MAAFATQWQIAVVEKGIMWPGKPEIFIIWSFTEKVCQPLPQCPDSAPLPNILTSKKHSLTFILPSLGKVSYSTRFFCHHLASILRCTIVCYTSNSPTRLQDDDEWGPQWLACSSSHPQSLAMYIYSRYPILMNEWKGQNYKTWISWSKQVSNLQELLLEDTRNTGYQTPKGALQMTLSSLIPVTNPKIIQNG